MSNVRVRPGKLALGLRSAEKLPCYGYYTGAAAQVAAPRERQVSG
jgi:hypothetical protein